MIFFDPELELTGKPGPSPTRPVNRSATSQSSSKERLPSKQTLAAFLRVARQAVRLQGEVTVLFTTDKAIRRLNLRFRGIDKATDVLSFPAAGPAVDTMAGDLAISVQTARQQAITQGHALLVEMKVLMLHGVLHLAGYDHEADGGQMARRERILRARLGLPQGLIERADANASVGNSPMRRKPRSAQA